MKSFSNTATDVIVEGLYEACALRPRNQEPFLSDEDVVLVDADDIVEIDKIAPIAQSKAVVLKQGLVFFEGIVGFQGLVVKMEFQDMVDDLDILQLPKKDFSDDTLVVCHQNALFLAKECGQGSVHRHVEGRIADRLDKILEGIDPIAFDSILDEIGHKDDHRALVDFPYLLGGLNAIDIGHVDIHEDQVEIPRILVQELEGI